MKRVLVVDDDRQNIELITQILAQEGHNVQSAADGEAALHRLKAWKPHLILLDVNMPGVSGIDLIPKIRSASEHDYASVVLVSAGVEYEELKKGLDAGADDYIAKPFRAHELIARVRLMLRFKEIQDSLRRANERIDELTSTDEVTGLLSFRSLFRRGEEEILRARRFKKPLSALLINLDGFSKVNQEKGFQAGNQVLQDTGKRLKGCMRNIDLVARVGSDEYFALLMETDLAGAEFVAERARDSIQAAGFGLTACIGVAGFSFSPTDTQTDQKMNDLVHLASEALRSAKASGPNSIEVYSFS